MFNRILLGISTAAMTLTLGAATAGLASAQPYYPPPTYAQQQQWQYERWQAGWDRGEYDRAHIVIGQVTGFEPYRLSIVRPDGVPQTIDLKNGTIIRPWGATPQPGQRVAIVGYYSRGTFIANRLVLRY